MSTVSSRNPTNIAETRPKISQSSFWEGCTIIFQAQISSDELGPQSPPLLFHLPGYANLQTSFVSTASSPLPNAWLGCLHFRTYDWRPD